MNTTQGRVLTQLLDGAWNGFTEMAFSQTGNWIFIFGLYMLILVVRSGFKTSRREKKTKQNNAAETIKI